MKDLYYCLKRTKSSKLLSLLTRVTQTISSPTGSFSLSCLKFQCILLFLLWKFKESRKRVMERSGDWEGEWGGGGGVVNGLKQLRHQMTGWAGAWTGGPALSYHCCWPPAPKLLPADSPGLRGHKSPGKKSPLRLPQWVGGTDNKQTSSALEMSIRNSMTLILMTS